MSDEGVPENVVRKEFVDGAVPQYLLAIHNGATYGSEIINHTGITRSYVSRLTDMLDRYNVIQTEKTGRRRLITLTAQGESIAETLERIEAVARELMPQWKAEHLPAPVQGVYVCVDCGMMADTKAEAEQHSHDVFAVDERVNQDDG